MFFFIFLLNGTSSSLWNRTVTSLSGPLLLSMSVDFPPGNRQERSVKMFQSFDFMKFYYEYCLFYSSRFYQTSVWYLVDWTWKESRGVYDVNGKTAKNSSTGSVFSYSFIMFLEKVWAQMQTLACSRSRGTECYFHFPIEHGTVAGRLNWKENWK